MNPRFFAREPADPRLRALAEGIRRFLEGRDVRFELGVLDLEQCPPFQQKVLLAEAGIPRGYVSTYGRIAGYIGHPGAGRAVGNALARNPFPIVIPCHRAVRSDGKPGGFQEGPDMKRRLLEMEGVGFFDDGRVAMDRVWY
ncbi:MAG TPA: MGMT family protein [Methanomicrobiales archaeon]|nr:MGMT family protein [Methanomicrobiales archaeon]